MSKYPRITSFYRYKGHPNGRKNVKCPCGAQAVGKVTIQVNWFRGDDEEEPRCEEHRNTIEPKP